MLTTVVFQAKLRSISGELPRTAGVECSWLTMLRPDPMRYRPRSDPLASPVRNGSNRILLNQTCPIMEQTGSMVLAFHREEELPPDIALDLRLHEILETPFEARRHRSHDCAGEW